MKKRKLKRSVKRLFYVIIFACISVFSLFYFNLDDKINKYLSENNITFKSFFIEKPKLKIIDEESNSRPIAVSINNNHSAWPLSGLEDAYLVYELIAEGGITRLLAFYKDSDQKKIGSVRSTRHYFLDYILENDAIFVHFGQSPQAKEDLSTLKVNNINGMYDYSPFSRDTSLGRSYEHTAFTSMTAINKEIKKKGYRTESEELLLKYRPTKVKLPDNSIDATNIKLEYSNYQTTTYKYDSENRVYKLYMDGKSQKDLITKKQYTVKNIIAYTVESTSIDSKDRQDIKNIGKGEGYFITNGKAAKIKWSKASRKDKTKYTYEDGTEITVNDGNTWIHIIPKGKKLEIK